MKFRLIEESASKHLREIIDKIDFIIMTDDINDYHFSTNESFNENVYEDEIEIYNEENLLNLTDAQLMQMPLEKIHTFTNTELLERIYNIDKSALSADQIELLQRYYKQYNVIADSDDIEYFLSKLKECDDIWISASFKNRNFAKRYGLKTHDLLDIIKHLKPSDYIESRKSINIGHLGDNLMIFQPTTVVVKDNIFEGLIIYIKIDVDESSGDICAVISFHETNHRNKLKDDKQ